MSKYINADELKRYIKSVYITDIVLSEVGRTANMCGRMILEYIDTMLLADVVKGNEIIEWHEVIKRKPTEEEKAEFAEQDVDVDVPYIFICDMPEDGEEILVETPYGVSVDECGLDYDYGYYLEERGDWDDVIAWAKMPKGKKQNDTDDIC